LPLGSEGPSGGRDPVQGSLVRRAAHGDLRDAGRPVGGRPTQHLPEGPWGRRPVGGSAVLPRRRRASRQRRVLQGAPAALQRASDLLQQRLACRRLAPLDVDVGDARPAAVAWWNLYGVHALALDPPDGAMGLLVKGSDGAVHVNQVAVDHVGGQIPPGPVPRAQVVNGGSYGGTGFHNSGLLASF